MIELLGLANALWQGALGPAGLVFLRVGAAMALLPAFGERSIPARIRVGLTLAFTLIVAPAAAPMIAQAQTASLLTLGGAEVIAGLAIGIVLRLMILALQIAGTIAANVTSLSQILGGASVDPQPAMGHVLVVGGLALLAMSGLHVRVAEAFIFSYAVFPPGQPIPSVDFAQWGTDNVARAFGLAFSLSAPFVLVSVVYNLALGAINRAMPQLMVAFVGAPAITFGGLAILALSAPILLEVWRQAFMATLETLGTG